MREGEEIAMGIKEDELVTEEYGRQSLR